MKKIKFFIEYSLIRIVESFFLILPRKWAYGMGECLGRTAGKILTKRDNLARSNLKKSFPTMKNDQIDRVVQHVWKNVGRTAIEFVYSSRMNRENLSDFISFEGKDHVEQARAQNRGVIFIQPHITNWEIGGPATALWLDNVTAIARPIKNPFVDGWIRKKRESTGLHIILHRQAVRASLRLLKQKKNIAILPDQNLYKGGIFVNFFGRPAATTTLPALLHSRTKAPVILGYTVRDKGKLKLVYEKPIQFPEIADKDERIEKYTQIISGRIENLIEKFPENWFWLHNRWKTQPQKS